MNYKTSKKYLNQHSPDPSGFHVTVYGVDREDRPKAMTWVFNKFENVIKISFAD